MDGASLLDPAVLATSRPIFAVADVARRDGQPTKRTLIDGGPPNFGVAAVSLVSGPHWFELSLADGELRSGFVAGHTQSGAAPVEQSDALTLLHRRVASAGFRIGS
jgi:hypothetical protein